MPTTGGILMFYKSYLCRSLCLALSGWACGVSAASIKAPSETAFGRMFTPTVPVQVRVDALAMALSAAWDASECQNSAVLADVVAAGLAREFAYAEFRKKFEGAANAACQVSGPQPVLASSVVPEEAIDRLLADVVDAVGTDANETGKVSNETNSQPINTKSPYSATAGLRSLSTQAAHVPAPGDSKSGPKTEPETEKKSKLDELIAGLETGNSDLRDLLRLHERMTEFDKLEDDKGFIKAICELDEEEEKVHLVNFSRCSQLVYQEIGSRYGTIVSKTAIAEELGKASNDPRIAGMKKLANDMRPRVEYAAALEASTRGANYGLYAGPSRVLQDDGKWKDGTEFLLRFNTEVFNNNPSTFLCPLGSWCRGFTDISYTTPGSFPKETANPAALPVNPFDQEGELRVRTGIISHLNPWFGMEYGVGFTSPVEDSAGFSRIEPMARVGAHFQTLYSDGVVGEVSMGLAHDRSKSFLLDLDPNTNSSTVGDGTDPAVNSRNDFVQKDYFNRAYMEGTVLFPRAEILGGWRLAARLSLDAPLNGNSEAEARASVLFYYPLSNWLDTFKPVQAKPKP